MQPNNAQQLEALFRRAVQFQLQGNSREALKSYDAVLRLDPKMAAAHCNRGIVLLALGRADDALASYDEAISIERTHADSYYNRGIALASLGRSEEALRSYDQAIEINPGHIAAHGNRGNTLRELGRPREALRSFDRVIALNPRSAMAHNHRGVALRELARLQEAVQSFERAIAIQPGFAEAHYNRGTALLALKRPLDALQSFERAVALESAVAETHHQQANALRGLGRLREALASCDRAVELKSDFTDAHNERGNVLCDLKRPDDALVSYERALALRPDFAEAHCNRGNALHQLKRLDEALESHDRAAALKPDYAPAYFNRANTLRELGRLNEALADFDRAIALDPEFADARAGKGQMLQDRCQTDEAIAVFDRALESIPDHALAALGKGICLLQTGNFEQGWPLYEWRKKKPGRTDFRQYAQPEWSGKENLDGKTLMVYAEQGLGDTIQFCRYALLAREQGARVVLAVQDSLVRLVGSMDPEIEVVGLTSQNLEFDFYAALLSLPLAFGTTLANCPPAPYLRAEPERIATWRARLGDKGFKIGICWQGNSDPEIDRGRSFSPRHFQMFAKLPDVRLVSLQKNDGIEQLLDLPPAMKVEILGDDFDTPPDAFIDTAAVMETLDLVVTSDTAIAHLAGALGRPTWVALKHVPDWRWLLDRSDSPWYPTMRLFRQRARDDWASVFSAMESKLTAILSERDAARF